MKRLIILAVLLASCSGSGIRRNDESAPVQPLPPPRPEAEEVHSRVGAIAANTETLAIVNVPLPPPENVPVWKWEDSYFEEIDERAEVSRLRPLRTKVLPQGDLELRIWRGFGITLLQGTVVARKDGRWSAKHLGPAVPGRDRRGRMDRDLPAPPSDWEPVWAKLHELGILTFPSGEEITCAATATVVGFSYVVECKAENAYRTYMYTSLNEANCEEAKRMNRIIEIIDEEFYRR